MVDCAVGEDKSPSAHISVAFSVQLAPFKVLRSGGVIVIVKLFTWPAAMMATPAEFFSANDQLTPALVVSVAAWVPMTASEVYQLEISVLAPLPVAARGV